MGRKLNIEKKPTKSGKKTSFDMDKGGHIGKRKLQPNVTMKNVVQSGRLSNSLTELIEPKDRIKNMQKLRYMQMTETMGNAGARGEEVIGLNALCDKLSRSLRNMECSANDAALTDAMEALNMSDTSKNIRECHGGLDSNAHDSMADN